MWTPRKCNLLLLCRDLLHQICGSLVGACRTRIPPLTPLGVAHPTVSNGILKVYKWLWIISPDDTGCLRRWVALKPGRAVFSDLWPRWFQTSYGVSQNFSFFIKRGATLSWVVGSLKKQAHKRCVVLEHRPCVVMGTISINNSYARKQLADRFSNYVFVYIFKRYARNFLFQMYVQVTSGMVTPYVEN